MRFLWTFYQFAVFFFKNFIAIHIFNVCAINRNNDLYDHRKNPSKHDGKLKNICPDNSFESSLTKASERKHRFSINWTVRAWSLINVKYTNQKIQLISICLLNAGQVIKELFSIMFFFSASTIVLQQFKVFHFCIETEYKSRSRYFVSRFFSLIVDVQVGPQIYRS